ncbi:MAG TPA: hypothetical protein VLB04_03235 [Methanotrichaceae archaeon]|nr:hypothetical protein [Methanotrichaceae archaeon]
MTIEGDLSLGMTAALMGLMATLAGVFTTYLLVCLRENNKAKKEFRNAVAIVYQEIRDNMLSLNAGTRIGLMKVNTSGLELLKTRNLYLQMPEDLLKDLLSIYWYFNFVNDIVNWELSLFMVSTLTNVDTNKIFEINDRQAKETHRRCLKEIEKTRILSRLEGLLK